jgi:hypothetical protein
MESAPTTTVTIVVDPLPRCDNPLSCANLAIDGICGGGCGVYLENASVGPDWCMTHSDCQGVCTCD